MPRTRHAALALLGLLALATASSPAETGPVPAATLPPNLGSRTDAALARRDLEAYRGWLKYLRFDAENAALRGATAEESAARARRLGDWLDRITADPRLIASLRGVQEWAYESPVDGSGQPFRLVIPTDYDPARPAPLSVYMHGYSGNHIEHSTGFKDHPGSFELAVLGRSRGGGYRALSEADVLQVVDYIEAHWSIDLDRVSLNGGSMGGGGTYRLGSRYPQRWSSGRPTCGYASFVPVGNLLTLPIYATHSFDDPTVSVLNDVGPLARLEELGGNVIFDLTNGGYGHAVWDYKEGNERGLAWEKLQVRPASRSVRHVDYAALDGGATRGWWAEVAEWGPSPRPAHFVLSVGGANQLFARLENITRLRLRIAESPLDAAEPLTVSVNGAVPVTLSAPLPPEAFLALGEKGWAFEAQAPRAPFRLHTPGSASLLYDGEPLLIVYGTKGSGPERDAMRAAASAASRSPIPAWPAGDGQSGKDGVPHSYNLYGNLNTKADTEVTDADIARCHLVLIGSERQNSLVARIAGSLPVQLTPSAVVCSDGQVFPGGHLALGLVHYNPLAPDRLIFWVASDDPATYAAKSPIPNFMGGGEFIWGNAFVGDLLVMDSQAPTVVACRSFDSRWRWVPGRETSPVVPAAISGAGAFSLRVGESVRRSAAADFALVNLYGEPGRPVLDAGSTRVSDLLPFFLNQPVGMFEVSGAEVRSIAGIVAAKDSGLLLEGPDPARVNPEGRYRVAMPVGVLWALAPRVKPAPRNYWLTGGDTGDAVERFLVGD
jgi:hypothetical protein